MVYNNCCPFPNSVSFSHPVRIHFLRATFSSFVKPLKHVSLYSRNFQGHFSSTTFSQSVVPQVREAHICCLLHVVYLIIPRSIGEITTTPELGKSEASSVRIYLEVGVTSTFYDFFALILILKVKQS